jgi:hypothetical protein
MSHDPLDKHKSIVRGDLRIVCARAAATACDDCFRRIKPVRQPGRHGSSGRCLVSVLVLIHSRPPPFAGVRVFVFAQFADGGERW